MFVSTDNTDSGEYWWCGVLWCGGEVLEPLGLQGWVSVLRRVRAGQGRGTGLDGGDVDGPWKSGLV